MSITDEGATGQARQIIHHHAVLRRGLERRAGTLAKENDLLLPALTGSGADLPGLLAYMHAPQAGAQA